MAGIAPPLSGGASRTFQAPYNRLPEEGPMKLCPDLRQPRFHLRLLFGRPDLGQRRGQRRDACRDRGCQRRQKEGYHQTYLQSSHKLLLFCLRSSKRFSVGSGSDRID